MAFNRGSGDPRYARNPAAILAPWTPTRLANKIALFDWNYGAKTWNGSSFVAAAHDDPIYRHYAIWPTGDTVYREQTNASYCPTYKIGANGLACADYDGGNQHLILANAGGFITFANDAARTYAQHVLIDAAGNYSMLMARSATDELRLNGSTTKIEFIVGGIGIALEGTAHATGEWTNAVATYSGAAGGELLIDGSSVGTASDVGGDGTSNDIYYGQRQSEIGSYGFNGRETYALVLGGIMSADEIANFKTYCESKEPT